MFGGCWSYCLCFKRDFLVTLSKSCVLLKIEKSHFLPKTSEVLPFCIVIYVVLPSVFYNYTRNVATLGEMRAVEIDFRQTLWNFFLGLVWKSHTWQIENCVTLCAKCRWISHHMGSPNTHLEVLSSSFGGESVLKLNFLMKLHGFSQNQW